MSEDDTEQKRFTRVTEDMLNEMSRITPEVVQKHSAPDEWTKLPDPEAIETLRLINPHLRPLPFPEQNTVVHQRALPFYRVDELYLYKVTDFFSARRSIIKYALVRAPLYIKVMPLKLEQLEQVNQHLGLTLDADSVADYVRFYLQFNITDKRRKQLIESRHDLLRYVYDDHIPEKIASQIRPLHIEPDEVGMSFTTQGVILDATGLHLFHGLVKHTGQVTLQYSECLSASIRR